DRAIRVVLQKAAKPRIDRVDPPAGKLFLVGEPVPSHVWTLQDATVNWDLGGAGARGQGASVEFSYPTAGERTVQVSVRDRSNQTSTATTTVRIVDAGLSITPPRGNVFERVATSLGGRAWGGVSEVTWRVNGEQVSAAA